jgi:hypothetical protein
MSDQKIPSVPATLVGPCPGTHAIVDDLDHPKIHKQITLVVVAGETASAVYFWGALYEVAHEKLTLLLNTSAAMCHAARWLALKLGCDPGATAPPWFYDADTVTWKLHGMKTTFSFYGDPEGERRCFGRGRLVPDIHKVTDPAEALAAACAVVGAA